jgi:hypothetical protein
MPSGAAVSSVESKHKPQDPPDGKVFLILFAVKVLKLMGSKDQALTMNLVFWFMPYQTVCLLHRPSQAQCIPSR